MREEPIEDAVEIIKMLNRKMLDTTPPEVVGADEAIVNENIATGADIDITTFPSPRMWPLDGGKYIGTCDAVITKDPDTGRLNVGTYRMMIKSKNEVGLYTSPGKDGGLDIQKWWDRGEPAPVAAVYGLDPLLFIVAATSFPKTESEYDYYGGISGAPIELFESDVTGLLLPAGAEIIVEGFCHPEDTFDEGPFGEFTGYYGRPEAPTRFLRIEKLRHKNDPIHTHALMADWPSNECGLFWAMVRAAKIWNDLDKLGIPGIKTVWSPPEAAGWGMTVVSIKQLYAGHAAQVMALAAQCMGGAYFSKYIVVVDDDVDATSLSEVVWAMVTRSRPAQSIDILRETWSTYLDPSQNPPSIRPWGSKCLINACMEYKHIDDFAPRTKLDQEVYKGVVGRWEELGFEGPAPKVDVFEDQEFTPRPT
jgi:4-hydroxy-3-polyprenylbenzoate decarboxylase